MDDEARRVRPEVVRALEDMADQIGRRPFSRDLIHRMEWLVEILISRGYLEPAHRALIDRSRGDNRAVRLAVVGDRHAVASVDPGCVERLHLCKARCCAMDVELSAADVAAGTLRWDLERPYLLARADHGLCEHLQRDGRCDVYADRPAACRAYDCVDDPRVWIDYDAKVPAPLPWWLVPIEQWDLSAAERAALVAGRFSAAPPAEGGEAGEAGEAIAPTEPAEEPDVRAPDRGPAPG